MTLGCIHKQQKLLITMIKFANLSRCYEELKDDLLPAYEEIHKSGQVCNGKYRTLVEDKLKEITGRRHCRLTTSGTTAILGALIAWNLKGKEVMASNYSYVASANQAALLNKVKLQEVDEDGLMCIPTEETDVDAVIPVSLFGNTVDYDVLLSKTGDAKIIADCAQSLGSKYKGRADGSIGDCAVFSFATNKPVPTAGTQGALVWDDESMCERVEMAFNNGKMSRNTDIESYGINGHAFELQAAQIYFGLHKMDNWQKRRTQIADYFNEAFSGLPFDVIRPKEYCESNWHKYVIKTNRRDHLYDYLRDNGIDCQKHYTDNFNNFFGDGAKMVQTQSLCDTVISLPNNQWIQDVEVEHMAQTVKDFYNE